MSEYRTPEEDTIGGQSEPDEAREGAGPEPEAPAQPTDEPEDASPLGRS